MDSDPRSSPLYEAGSGYVLSHFASLAAPGASKTNDWRHHSLGVQRSPGEASSEGPRSVSRPKQVKVFDDFILDNQTESSDRSSDMSAETDKSYALRFSPPRLDLKQSKKETNVAPQVSTACRSILGSSMGMSYRTEDSAEEETYSPVASSVKFLMSRDPHEEERLLNSKTDSDKVYLYKKQYADTYEHAVALLKYAALLERERADKQSDLEYLRSTIKTQTQIINTLSDSKQLSGPIDCQQEKQIQALCREVTGLVMQLSQRDLLINSLHEERDKSMKAINDLKMSQGLSSTSASEATRFTDSIREKLDDALREKREALENKARLAAELNDLQVLYKKCEAARSALSDGLDRAEKQTTALHAQ